MHQITRGSDITQVKWSVCMHSNYYYYCYYYYYVYALLTTFACCASTCRYSPCGCGSTLGCLAQLFQVLCYQQVFITDTIGTSVCLHFTSTGRSSVSVASGGPAFQGVPLRHCQFWKSSVQYSTENYSAIPLNLYIPRIKKEMNKISIYIK